ncbi:MAG TPA: DUF3108 domain-containing protein [Chthoniobacterales bacterium]|jgi:hypothetical protein|nr:DUF3108 domain-containing protein [Chthoniobacterales bacterium]
MIARIGLAAISMLWLQSAAAATPSWESTITASSAPAFPNPRPMHARYGFGWSGFPCATAEVALSKPPGNRLELHIAARTTGLARALWKFDATHLSIVEASTLHPISMEQIENDRGKKIVTNLSFNSSGVVSKVTETPGTGTKVRRFEFPHLFDLQSALLYLRSQSLQERDVQRIVVYAATAPYLATVTVLGRERVTVPAGTYNAIKFDLQLNRIKDGQLQPHRKFRRASAWLSDDPDRVLLKIEAQVFVGSVICELQAVDYDKPKS